MKKIIYFAIFIYSLSSFCFSQSLPDPPQLLLPENNATGVNPYGFHFLWHSVEDATNYELMWDDNPEFSRYYGQYPPLSGTIFPDTATVSSWSFSLLEGGIHYWRVRAINSAGNGPWSEIWSFFALPKHTTILQPQNGAMLSNNFVTAVYRSLRGASYYKILLYNYSTSNEPLIDQIIQDTSFTINNLEYQKIYHLDVYGLDHEYNYHDIHASVNFTFGEVPLDPAPPTPIYPLNGAAGIELLPQFQWNSTLGSTLYWIKLSKDSLFSSIIFHQGMSDTSFTYISGLNYDTKYFWQLRAQGMQGDMGSWSPVYSFTTAPHLPEKPRLYFPTNGETNLHFPIFFKWDDLNYFADEVFYNLNIESDDGTTVFDTVFINQSSFYLSNLNSGSNFKWKVRAGTNKGYGEWSDTWQFSTMLELDKPILLEPTNYSVQQGQDFQFIWHQVDLAELYQVQISLTDGFDSLVYNNNIADTTLQRSLTKFNSSYYWRVRAVNDPAVGPWSDIWQFQILEPLQAPQLVFPQNLATNIQPEFNFSWNEVKQAEKYYLQVSSNPEFSQILINENNITDTSYFCSTLPLGLTYYWRIKSINQYGESEWSSIHNFILVQHLAAPVLIYPANNSTDIITEFSFSWHAVAFSKKYWLQVSDDSNFSSMSLDRNDLVDTTFLSTTLESGTQYFWRVKALRFDTTGSNWSDIYSFSTKPASIPQPQLISPSNNSIDLTTEPTLTWQSVENYSTYHLQLSRDFNFSILVVNENNIGTTQKKVNNLNEGEKYYWRVRVSQDGDVSSWSDTWNFITKLSKPNNLTATQMDSSVILSWQHNIPNLNYIIERETNAMPALLLDSVFNQFTFTDSSISNNQTYTYSLYAKSNFARSDTISVKIYISISSLEDSEKPNSFYLSQNYPNPFNPTTSINYSTPLNSFVKIDVYTITGERLFTLVDEYQPAGTYNIVFDASNLTSGIYLYKLKANNHVAVKKMILLK